jgi:hypothetical protein
MRDSWLNQNSHYYKIPVSFINREASDSPVTLWLNIDTGSDGTELIDDRQTHQLRYDVLRRASNGIRTPYGSFGGAAVRVPSLSISRLSVNNCIIAIIEVNPIYRVGALGMDILQHFIVTMDFPGKRFYIQADPDDHSEDDKATMIRSKPQKTGN